MVKDGSALGHLAEIDTVVFDKGHVDFGRSAPGRLAGLTMSGRDSAGLASHSRHPYSRALLEAAGFPHLRSNSTKSSSIPGTDLRLARERSSTGLAGRSGHSLTEPTTTASRCREMNLSCLQRTAAFWLVFVLRIVCGRMLQRR